MTALFIPAFPLTAVVGQEAIKLALLLAIELVSQVGVGSTFTVILPSLLTAEAVSSTL